MSANDKMDIVETTEPATAAAADGDETEEEDEMGVPVKDSKKEEPENADKKKEVENAEKSPSSTIEKDNEKAPPPEQEDAIAATTSSSRLSKKRPRSPSETADGAAAPVPAATASSSTSHSQHQQAAVSAASAAAAAQVSATMGWNGLYSLLSASVTTNTSSGSGNSNNLPTVEQVQQAALKSVQECPPFCHLSKSDSAPQLKVSLEERRLLAKGGMRGFRMARATHGVSSGNYYYEALILDPPPVSEIAASLPPNIRMGKKLQESMQQALLEEQKGLPKTSTCKFRRPEHFSRRRYDLDYSKQRYLLSRLLHFFGFAMLF